MGCSRWWSMSDDGNAGAANPAPAPADFDGIDDVYIIAVDDLEAAARMAAFELCLHACIPWA